MSGSVVLTLYLLFCVTVIPAPWWWHLARRQFGALQPEAELVIGLLRVDEGWQYSFREMNHPTGVHLSITSDNTLSYMAVSNTRVNLNPRSKHEVSKVLLQRHRKQEAAASDQALRDLAAAITARYDGSVVAFKRAAR